MADPAIRFLGFFKQPDSDSVSFSNPYEFDESDVIWSPDVDESLTIDSSDAIELNDSDSPILSTSASTVSNSSSQGNSNHSFRYLGLGLSAALIDHDRSLVQRKSSMKMIPPVSNPRSVSSSDDLSGSYTGRFHQSAPVNVPIWPKANNNNNFNGSAKLGFCEEEDEEVEEEMLPPHEIVAKSHSTTFSVFEGVGRTLKGRDLRRVRNAVFQKTGFLD